MQLENKAFVETPESLRVFPMLAAFVAAGLKQCWKSWSVYFRFVAPTEHFLRLFVPDLNLSLFKNKASSQTVQ